MTTKQLFRKLDDVTPIFGLRYLEEEAAEINGVAGCLELDQPIDPGDGSGGGGGGGYTQYTTNCDYTDYD